MVTKDFKVIHSNFHLFSILFLLCERIHSVTILFYVEQVKWSINYHACYTAS